MVYKPILTVLMKDSEEILLSIKAQLCTVCRDSLLTARDNKMLSFHGINACFQGINACFQGKSRHIASGYLHVYFNRTMSDMQCTLIAAD